MNQPLQNNDAQQQQLQQAPPPQQQVVTSQQQQVTPQQQYAPPPQYQQQQQIQMQQIPPQQTVAPPQHQAYVINSGQQNDTAMQTQQMMLNAQLMQTIQNGNKPNLPSNVSGATLPVHIFCNSCKTECVTKVTENPCTVYTWLWFCFCFYSVLILLCFLPGCFKNQHTFSHYCSNCGFKVGEKQAQCT